MFSSKDAFLSDQRLLEFLKKKRDDRIQNGASFELKKTAKRFLDQRYSVRILYEERIRLKPCYRWTLLHSMFFTSNTKEFV